MPHAFGTELCQPGKQPPVNGRDEFELLTVYIDDTLDYSRHRRLCPVYYVEVDAGTACQWCQHSSRLAPNDFAGGYFSDIW